MLFLFKNKIAKLYCHYIIFIDFMLWFLYAAVYPYQTFYHKNALSGRSPGMGKICCREGEIN